MGRCRDLVRPLKIFVVAHDGHCEGHSLPYLAFERRDEAMAWCRAQSDTFSVAEVPIYPGVPVCPWYQLEPVRDPDTRQVP